VLWICLLWSMCRGMSDAFEVFRGYLCYVFRYSVVSLMFSICMSVLSASSSMMCFAMSASFFLLFVAGA